MLILGAGCLNLVCVVVSFWLSASHVMCFWVDGMLLALCCHGKWPYVCWIKTDKWGYWVERPGWF